jgi:hypothetical protein
MTTTRNSAVAALMLFSGLEACGPAIPAERTGPSLSAFISDLPIPSNATTIEFRDTFVDPKGELHRQGTLDATVQLDSSSFATVQDTARRLNYQPIGTYRGPYRVPAMEAARSGLFRLEGDLGKDFALVVLNTESRTVTVSYVRISGLP